MQPSLGKLVKKEKAKKKCCCFDGEFLLFCTPQKKKFQNFFKFQKTSFFSAQNVIFSKIYINFFDIIIIIIIISLGGKN
jgi:hypothetical protein